MISADVEHRTREDDRPPRRRLLRQRPYETYAWMRVNAPVDWDPINELWGISRYDDIVEIETHKDVFNQLRHEQGRVRAEHPG